MVAATRIQIGVVGVDSGQLLLTDPCYIDGQWIPNTEPDGHTPYRDTRDGNVYRFPEDFRNYGDDIPNVGVPNDLIAADTWVQVTPEWVNDPGHEYSYRGCCRATCEGKSAQLLYPLGHAGAGVAVPTGYGDGVYPVYAETNDEGRVVRVTVDFGD